MTEEEWLACRRKSKALTPLLKQFGERKLRLFGVACCTRIQRVVDPERVNEARLALQTAERYADGNADATELSSASYAAEFVTLGDVGTPFLNVASDGEDLMFVADMAINELFFWERKRLEDPSSSEYALSDERQAELDSIITSEEIAQFKLLSDITGDGRNNSTLRASWLTKTVVSLANSIYTDRAFDRMPILADALEEAGCDNADILTHCRGEGPHVRGCWVVDGVLGKS